jgi:hypothetical protein
MPIIHDEEDDDEVVFVKTIEANEANEAKPSRTGSVKSSHVLAISL